MNSLFSLRRTELLIALLLFPGINCLYAQPNTYTYFYRVYLRDKGENKISNFTANELLSEKAIVRRQTSHVSVPDYKDLPVSKSYLDKISLLGLTLHTTSKWMNTALFKSKSVVDTRLILALPFVTGVKIVKSPGRKKLYNNKLDFKIIQSDFPAYDRPISMVNGNPLHDSGFNGKNILIAILDGGFMNADRISSLSDLRAAKGIRSTHNFVNNNDSVYNSSTHGTAVLSVLAGNIPGVIAGTAPGAKYLLIKTEDVDSEFPCEEDFWAAGAEYADSVGADIISSSLGYSIFDDSTMNYKVSDLDGNTAFVTRVADIAASKGVLVVNSAGNERTSLWKYIIFPADGDSVIAAGAVDGNNKIADFSSAGPSSDRRVKPDNVTMGVNVSVQVSENLTGRASGTSFSCPVLAGMAACLMQAVPGVINNDIIKTLHVGADRYNFPDSLYGFGIPDMVKTLTALQDKYIKLSVDEPLVYPNPTKGDFEIIFPSPPGTVRIEVISEAGKLIFSQNYTDFPGRMMNITQLEHCSQGLYLLRIVSGKDVKVLKIIKLNK